MSLTTAFSSFLAFTEPNADFNNPQFKPHFKLFLDGIYGLEVDLKLNDAVQLVDFVLYDNKADDYDYYHELLKDLCDLIHDTLPKLDNVKLLDLLVTLNGFKNTIVHSVIEEIVDRLGRAKYSKTIGDYMLKTKGFQAIKLGSNYVEEERISEPTFHLVTALLSNLKTIS